MRGTEAFKELPSQTAGPFVHIGCAPNFVGNTGIYPEDLGTRMITGDAKGERITVTACIWDGTGTPLRDALVEIWQADADGIYPGNDPRGAADPNFTGWGRCPASFDDGTVRFETVKPGAVPYPDGRPMAPHITFWIVARGINIALQSRMLFPDEETANAADPILARIEHQVRVPTLIAEKRGDGAYHWDIHLQGDKETVFFDV